MTSLTRMLLAGLLAATLTTSWGQAPTAKTEVLWLG